MSARLSSLSWDALIGSIFSWDALSTMAAKAFIKILREIVITYIRTGRFQKPTFVLNYMLDPQMMAENAARIFLSDLTGLNFCSNVGDVSRNLSFSLNLSLSLECSLANKNDFNRILTDYIRRPETVTPRDYYLWLQRENDYTHSVITAESKKLEAEARALIGRAAETITGDGFLGIRDPATGKVKTPGEIVAEPLRQTIASDYRGVDIADELSDAVAAVINVIFSTVLEKIINGATSLI